jgi:hypothetical protein
MGNSVPQNNPRWRGHVGPLPTEPGSPFTDMQLPAAWGVWLDGGSRRISSTLLDAVLHALDDLNGVVWHVSDGGSRSPVIKERQRAFGPHPGVLDGEPVVSETIDLGGRRVYADTGWMNPHGTEELARLLTRSTAPLDVSVAFFRSKSSTLTARWSAALLGLLWIWIRRTVKAPEVSIPGLASTVLALLVRDALELDGVVALLVDSEDAGRLLVLVTNEVRAHALRDQLDSGSTINWVDNAADMGRPQWFAFVR